MLLLLLISYEAYFFPRRARPEFHYQKSNEITEFQKPKGATNIRFSNKRRSTECVLPALTISTLQNEIKVANVHTATSRRKTETFPA